jgi:uncharacterized cupredoxin-like copper-binding protein
MKQRYLLVILLILFSLTACEENSNVDHTVHQEQTIDELAVDLSSQLRVIAVETTDQLRYSPETLTVQTGETIRFEVTNSSTIEHEFVVGDQKLQEEHAEFMAEMSMNHQGMQHGDMSSYALTIPPGETASLVINFEESGTLIYGCHIPGHYEAGMSGTILIETAE